MSRASAEFFFDDGDKLHGIYNGSSDYMAEFLSRDSHEPWDWYYGEGAWKDSRWEGKGRAFDRVQCDHEGEHVLVRSDYGSGTFWHGKACRDCLVFKGPFAYGYGEYSADFVPYFSTEEQARASLPALPRGASNEP
jgi:hypothetical protein